MRAHTGLFRLPRAQNVPEWVCQPYLPGALPRVPLPLVSNHVPQSHLQPASLGLLNW